MLPSSALRIAASDCSTFPSKKISSVALSNAAKWWEDFPTSTPQQTE